MESIYELCFYGGLILAILLLVVSIVLFIALNIPKVFGDLTGRNAKKSIKEMKEGTPVKDSVSKKEQAKYYNQGSGKIKVRETVSTEKRKSNRDDTTDSLKPRGERNLAKKTEVLEKSPIEPEETIVLSNDDIGSEDESTNILSDGDTKADDKAGLTVKSEDVLDEESTDILSAATEDEDTAILAVDKEDEDTAILAADKEDEDTAVLAVDEEDGDTAVLASDEEDEETAILIADEEEDATAVLCVEGDNEETTVLTADEEATSVLRGDDADSEDEGATTVLAGRGKNNKLSRKYKVEYSVILIHTDETL